MTLYGFLFYMLTAVIVVSTGLAITRRNLVHAVVYLVLSFFGSAMLFYLFGAPLLAALEVIIYAGAIMILFLFIIMMLKVGSLEERMFSLRQLLPAGGLALIYVAAEQQKEHASLSAEDGLVEDGYQKSEEERAGLTNLNDIVEPVILISTIIVVYSSRDNPNNIVFAAAIGIIILFSIRDFASRKLESNLLEKPTHSQAFRIRRFLNWFPMGLTYAFLYMARYNLTVSQTALGEMMSKSDFGISILII